MSLVSRFVTAVAAATILAAPYRLESATGEPWRVHALVGARVVLGPGRTLERATIVVRDGVIAAVGPDLAPPADARIWNLAGKSVYPGLIDGYVPAARLGPDWARKSDPLPEPDGPIATPRAPGASHELASVRPELDVAETLRFAAEPVERLRNLGFVAAGVVPDAGIFRGQSAVVSLGTASVSRSLLRAGSAQVLAFEEQRGEYPDALQGVIAVIRQTLIDARWYRDAVAAWSRRPAGRERPEASRALESLAGVVAGKQRVVLDALADPVNVTRAARIAKEFGLDLTVVATGGEYRRLEDVRSAGVPLLVPLDFPEPPRVGGDELEWALVATNELRHWKRAPSNPRWLHQAGVRFALTTAKVDDPAVFPERLRQAIDAGLPKDAALAALTTVPAELLGVSSLLGTLDAGKVASLIVASGDLFAEDTAIEQVWVEGQRFETGRKAPAARDSDPVGAWLVSFEPAGSGPRALLLELSRDEAGELLGRARSWPPGPGEQTLVVRCAAAEGSRIRVLLQGARFATGMDTLLVADLDGDGLTGTLDAPGAQVQLARGERLGGTAAVRAKLPRPPRETPRPEGGPLATPSALLVRNATVWTAGPEGVLEGADLRIEGGRITGVGRGLAAPAGSRVIDATGRHVTPGLIDAHSHTAIASDVNECTQSVTAEVRIADVVDPEDWNLYSELAGGLTAANLLHGSCNSIGGQSQTIKLRWGAGAEELKLEGARPGIKFALGENVKQSNFGDKYVVRYPQTRMGVEQVIRERFLAARDYQREQDEYRDRRKTDPDALPPRPDLELDALVEILRGERLIHCHSYRQSELVMLLGVTRDLGITIGTLQHVLDGYKVADEIAAQGVGASTFSDWWAYKFEVYDAIPYNGALMWDRGVVVSFNSDSAELARRMNTEATKAVKYGGVPEAEAFKMVTINPARQLRIDHRVGSLEPGKDGDFVIWSGHPLATSARAEETWIEGRQYFDRAADLARRGGLEAERRALIQEAREGARQRGSGAAVTGGSGYRPVADSATHDCMDAPHEVGP